jgi:thiosulfate reductase / polysulfide reductase chain A
MMTTAIAPNAAGVATAPLHSVFSMCGMCATRCPIRVDVKDGRAVWLQGNPNDKAMGEALCARGAAGLALEGDDERPQHPMIRSGPRGSGQWRRATWDEALDYVAASLKDVIARQGARAIALSDRGGPFVDLTKSFIRALGSPNYCDHDSSCGRNAHHASKSLLGLGRTDVVLDYKNARHIVLYGRNLLEALQVKEVRNFMAGMKNGARCTYIDPRVTVTANKATRHWQIRPNTDYALNLAIIHEVLKTGVYDKAFVARWVEGVDALRESVKDCTPEWQAQFTGIPADELRTFVAEIAADAPRVIFHPGWMTARHKQSFYVARTAHILNALMGSFEVEGGVLLAKGPGDAGRKGLKKLLDRIPKVFDPRADGVGWKYKHWDAGGGIVHRLFAAMDSADPYPIEAYFAYRHDPLTALSDPEALKKSFDKLKLLVAIDVNYSETAWYADVILPETTYLERANILSVSSGLKPAINMRDQAIAPRFDSRPAWWIFRELARRMGVGEYFDFETIEDIWEYQLEGTGVTIAQLREKGFVSLAEKPIMADRMSGLKFKTASGKIEIVSQSLSDAGIESLAPFVAPEPLAGDRFRLLFGRPGTLTHGQSANNPLLAELFPDNPLMIHPQRAVELGIADGDKVEVSSGGHAETMRAQVSDWIHPDAVFMLHGFGRTVPRQSRAYRKGVADQRLQVGMLNEYDPAGGGSAMTETIVRLRKL